MVGVVVGMVKGLLLALQTCNDLRANVENVELFADTGA